MAIVTVYEFELYDKTLRCYRRDGRLATIDTIEAKGWLAIKATAREVDAKQIDGEGLYAGITPSASESQPQEMKG